ncbi:MULTISPECIES: dephospho-CoA kinase [unclassified Lactobacillus]|uniref:dephospho-CoA kinase n=1 Tax=unclassified Lactobacillus TaxID=2620435 RepID=UPI000EFB13FE|nr:MULTISPECIES: dephospho-CoA kinase [unclassified Lactobacillus]RMC24200.1 dephospho-CoA kinase [Lactobacillus sp. ESL0247]RMC28773.1 dephospho-CoA kinase [Lactobacillus sp. ESL0246]RMC31430.1 dephospho-CoA kinase [Lactobacillus sp. ESL0245]
MTLVLGLTGGIASGKSTVDDFFKERQLPVIDCDQIAHEILDIGQQGYNDVVKHFGKKILNSNQTVNRQYLGQMVFSDKGQLQVLNQITHPLIFREIQTKITRYRKLQKPFIVVDAPVLFESGGQNYCDRTILVTVPEKTQLERLMARDHLTKGNALKRIHSQMPLAQKEKLADYVITNTGTIEELNQKLSHLLVKIKKEEQYGMS